MSAVIGIGPWRANRSFDGARDVGRHDRRRVGGEPARIGDRGVLQARLPCARAGARKQRRDQVLERQIGIEMVPDAHLPVDREHGTARVEPALRQGEIIDRQ